MMMNIWKTAQWLPGSIREGISFLLAADLQWLLMDWASSVSLSMLRFSCTTKWHGLRMCVTNAGSVWSVSESDATWLVAGTVLAGTQFHCSRFSFHFNSHFSTWTWILLLLSWKTHLERSIAVFTNDCQAYRLAAFLQAEDSAKFCLFAWGLTALSAQTGGYIAP